MVQKTKNKNERKDWKNDATIKDLVDQEKQIDKKIAEDKKETERIQKALKNPRKVDDKDIITRKEIKDAIKNIDGKIDIYLNPFFRPILTETEREMIRYIVVIKRKINRIFFEKTAIMPVVINDKIKAGGTNCLGCIVLKCICRTRIFQKPY